MKYQFWCLCCLFAVLSCGDGSKTADTLSDGAAGAADAAAGSADAAMTGMGGQAGAPRGGDRDAGFADLDAGRPMQPNGGIPRLVVVTFQYGFLESSFRMRFPDVVDPETTAWQRSLTGNGVVWSPALVPLADLAEHVTVVDGLALHTIMGDRQSDEGSQDATMLTGNIASQQIRGAGSPSLDWLIGKLHTPPGGVPLVVTSELNQNSYDDTLKRLPSRTLSNAWSDLFMGREATCLPPPRPAQVDSMRAFSSWWQRMTPIVAAAFRCDRTRAFTLHPAFPSAAETGFAGSFHQDVMDQWQTAERPGPMGERIAAIIANYSAMQTFRVGALARELAATPVGNGTMLDHTLIMLLGKEGHPGHQPFPWQMVMIGGRGLGLQTGRYIRTQPSTVLWYQTSIRVGPAHNHGLISIAQLFGLDINVLGLPAIQLQNPNSSFESDLSGPLPELFARP